MNDGIQVIIYENLDRAEKVVEAPIYYKDDGSFAKETQTAFDQAIEGLKNGRRVALMLIPAKKG